mgnify:CR=1 FL=1
MENRKQVRKIMTTLLVSGLVISLGGCQNVTKQDMGMVTGAVAGGLIGSTIGQGRGQVLAIAAGTVAGGVVGGMIGKSMDDTDRLKAEAAIERNKTNQASTWHNPDTGATYTVKPKKTYQRANHQYCREYTMTADIAGKKQQTYGTACRQPDGSWKVQS